MIECRLPRKPLSHQLMLNPWKHQAHLPSKQADDGTFMEEPAGAVASIRKKVVSVGSLEWVRSSKLETRSVELR
nr:copper-transporting ATPase PAA1, chloroplastic [Tanacetum cinerariifolium]